MNEKLKDAKFCHQFLFRESESVHAENRFKHLLCWQKCLWLN